ncbi:MAG: lipid-A-disaccharide synthase [Bacteroidia bacterium]|nr:lipid-A-disaccharide synthase [Bacteroidia bacterium]MCC6768121.1 lipid-A-disaccharide synthase [Bacteroidia bacterium]
MKYYIIAGEASGDLHGAGLIKALHKSDPEAQIRCWGGELMQTAGAELVKHYRELAFMGFTEVIMNLPEILRNLRFCKTDVLNFRPDVIILIDYPGFNMRIASFARAHNIKVYYYISPQIWAWKQNRGWKLKKTVDRMFVILPFEKAFYKRFDMEVSYHGHPLIDVIGTFNKDITFFERHALDATKKIIALLPGSRTQEIKRMLRTMLEATKEMSEYQVVVAAAPSIENEFYYQVAGNADFKIVKGDTYQLLSHAHMAAVTSGTATLETGLFGVPMVVCYAGGRVSYLLAKQLIKVKYISLVNLILNKSAIPELIQHDMNKQRLKNELSLIGDEQSSIRIEMLNALQQLRGMCGEPGVAERIATEMVKLLKQAE